ncbi:hypothetical protein [Clostridium tagluense]|uniref:Uncharacterized protein n=1 Tax=Clostridium tagluense TaxID=360422 RepID=A0A401UPC0_9CLOT|nr:hypothetical protein [Clostridium tagluense]GCD11395.1 hypothetical protein Ctaglu_30180 [Clostridium tagluense]
MEVLFMSLSIIFFVLFFACGVAIIAGCIKPQLVIRWGNAEKRNKKNVMKYYGISLIVCFILLLTTYTSFENVKAVKVAKAEVELARITANKIATDKAIEDKKIADKIISDKVAADKIIKARAVADKVIKDKAIKDKIALDKEIASDKEIADKEDDDKRIVNEQKEITPITKQSTSTTKDYTAEIKSIQTQIEAQKYELTKLSQNSQEYRNVLTTIGKLLQRDIDLTNKQIIIDTQKLR